MITILFFLFGIIIGSFLNVVICRLQTEETLLGRSHCTKCEKRIAWYDNVPLLSFLILRGKCRNCTDEISWQYPLVEFWTGILFALVGQFIFSPTDPTSFLPTIFYLGLFSMLVVIFVHDLLTMYIPMIMIWIALSWTAAYLALSQWLAYSQSSGMDGIPLVSLPYIFAGVGAGIFFWLLVWVSHETWMGMGDVYLALLVGLVTGWPGVLWAMTFSFGLGAAGGLTLIALGKKGMKSQVPFAPFLVLGVIIVALLPKMFPILQYVMMF
ncbi:MAG: prepilin peptidase [Candidatus Moranbacteria bacterium]|nr:prepilin peptidase [Candidatus Moranbacteria bacterium]